jgi:hypothetical protein
MFKPGQSGNPGGRTPIPKELKEKLSAEAPRVLDFWINAYQDESLNWNYRNKAAENIVAYAYGKPKEILDVDISSRNDITILSHEEKIAKLKELLESGIIEQG